MNKPASNTDRSALVRNAGVIWFGLVVYPLVLIFLGFLIPGAWIGFAAFCGFLLLCHSVFLWNKLAFILLVPLFVYKFSSFVSLILISFGLFIPEIGRYGEADLSSAFYLAVTSVHFGLIVLFASQWMGKKVDHSLVKIYRLPAELDFAFLFIFGTILYQILVLIYTGISYGFPLLIGMDRFFYRGLHAGEAFINILNYKAAIALLAAMLIASPDVSRWRKSMVSYAYFALFSLYALFGEKFSALILVTALFSLPFMLRRPERISEYLRKISAVLFVVIIFALSLVYYVYSDYGTQTASVTFERMFGRMAQQSQLWYLATRTFPGLFSIDTDSINAVWNSLFLDGVDANLTRLDIGSYYFTVRFSPQSIQQSIYEMQGLNQFTQVSEAYWLSVAGLPGLIFYLLVSAFIFSVVMVCLSNGLTTTNFIVTYLWGSVFVFMMTSLNQALPHQIFGVNYLRWYLFAAFVHFCYYMLQRVSYTSANINLR